jgi:hydrogenase expression/formation protein HypE
LHVLRDPTRGGLATTLNEIATQSQVGMSLIEEADIPVLPQVEAACELLGLDPLYVANEGKLIAICAPEVADTLLAAMRAHPLGAAARRIGTVTQMPTALCRWPRALAAAAWWIGSAASSCRGFAD